MSRRCWTWFGRTEPGPFRSQTWRMGTYLGVRDGDRLVAMAGERLHLARLDRDQRRLHRSGLPRLAVWPPDWSGAVGAGIQARGEQAMLHVLATQSSAPSGSTSGWASSSAGR